MFKSKSNSSRQLNNRAFLLNIRKNNCFSESYNGIFKPAYFYRTTFVYANLYTKDKYEKDEINKSKLFVEKIKSTNHFMDAFGWRIQDSIFEIEGETY